MNSVQNSEKKKFLICGNYGIGNLGDEAILEGIIKILHNSFTKLQITVLSSNPQQTSEKYSTKFPEMAPIHAAFYWPCGVRSFFKFIFTLQFLQTIKSYWQANLFILGGGGLFSDEKPRAIFIWTVQTFFAVLLRKKIFCLGQSVGPLKTKFGRNWTKWVFKQACAITVRDHESAELLKELGIADVKVLVDPAFALAYNHAAHFERKKFVVLSLRPWIKGNHERIDQELAKFVEWLYSEHGLKTLFIPFQIEQENDLERYESLRRKIAPADNNMSESGNSAPEEILELFEDYGDLSKVMAAIGSSHLLIGMRLHSVIFSVLTQTPFIGLSYSEKVKNFIKTLGIEEFIDYPEITFERLKQEFEKVAGGTANREKFIAQLEKAKLKGAYVALDHVKLLQKVVEGG